MVITVRIIGGLGNQLFQYAYAKKISKVLGAKKLILDVRGYEKYKVRKLEILDMDLELNNVEIVREGIISIKYEITRNLFRAYQYFYKKIKKKPCDTAFRQLSKYGLYYSSLYGTIPSSKISRDIFISGYFQSSNLMNECLDVINEEFILKSENKSKEYIEILDKIENKRNLAISIRCGEDFKKAGLNFCDVEYYLNALKKMDGFHDNILLFSDEPQNAKRLLKLDNVIEIPLLTPCEQLDLLSKCDDYIIPNSSFAWWGAYLSKNKNKKVIMPDKWYDILYTQDSGYLFNGCEINS